jgi:hypothetical protein
MNDRSFWEVANSVAVDDGYRDVAVLANEREFVARVLAGFSLLAHPRIDERPARAALTEVDAYESNVVSLDAYRASRHWNVA